MSKYVITYDVGTTGVKTCLIEIGDTMRILASDTAGYGLYVDDETGVKGGAEQDADEWWSAMCSTTRNVFNKCVGVTKDQVEGISFCSAMQGLVLVDKAGNCIRRPMTYMDQRAGDELKKGIAHGVQIAGAEVTKLLKYLRYTGAVSSSVKDPIWKYRWVREHEPENFKKVYKWLDVKEYLICRLTGEFVMTQDSAFGTLLYDTRKGHEGWCKPICDMVGVDMKHLPEIKKCTDKVGEVTAKAAEELGLAQGTAVYGGGGDASLIGVGAGAVEIGDAHIYSGTSGWVGTVVPEQMVDTGAMMAAIVGANPETFNYFGELETSNKCVGWVKDHLALDEIGVNYVQTAVGDKYVYEEMMNHGHRIGGEQSGHIIFSKYANTGDGILTALKLVQVVLDRKKTLSQLAEPVKIYPQVLKNIRVTDKTQAQNDPEVKAAVAKAAAELGDSGRILLRESGTEPLVRVMVEAESTETCERIVDEIIALIKARGYEA